MFDSPRRKYPTGVNFKDMVRTMRKIQGFEVLYFSGTTADDLTVKRFSTWKKARKFMRSIGAHYVRAVII